MKLKNFLNETSMTTAGVAGHYGKKGQDIDILFAGPFHPDYGEVGDLLKGQLSWKDSVRELTDKVTPVMELLYKLIDIDYDFDEIGNPYQKNVTDLSADESGFDLSSK
jgi:hypothetical protein